MLHALCLIIALRGLSRFQDSRRSELDLYTAETQLHSLKFLIGSSNKSSQIYDQFYWKVLQLFSLLNTTNDKTAA